MDKNLTYQKARRIRGTKITDLLADQLLYEPSIMKSIGKTISLKTQSGIKGIKEKFDPLNIAKFLTGGSKLAPALLGRLTGRDVRDIEYFTGRNRPLRVGAGRSTASRIGPVPGQGGDIQGINEQLLKIYKFLKSSSDQDIKRKEKEQNFAEEKQLESERRHKELIDALEKLTGKKTATPLEDNGDEGGGLFGRIKDIVHKVLDGLEWVRDIKSMGNLKKLSTFMKSPIFGLLMGPLLYVGAIVGLAELFKEAVKLVPNYAKVSAEEAKNVLENGSQKDIDALGGREKLLQIVGGEKEQAQRILNEQPELSIEERAKYEKIAGLDVKEQTATQLRPVPPRPDETKGLAGKNKAAKWDMQFGATHNPDGTPKVKMAAQSLPQGVEPATDQSRADAAATDPRRVDLPKGTAFGVKPHGIPTVDDRLNKVMTENISANLPEKPKSENQNIINNMSSVSGQTLQLASLSEIAVHNDEPTFMRMIMGSTRVV